MLRSVGLAATAAARFGSSRAATGGALVNSRSLGRIGGRSAAAQLSTDAPKATDVLVNFTLVDYAGKRYPITGFVGYNVSHAVKLNNLEEVLDLDGSGGYDFPPQVHHKEADWVEDRWGEGISTMTPHVILEPEWFQKTLKESPISADEEERLEELDFFERGPRTPTSRIATEIVLTKDLEGMPVHVPDQYPTELP